MTDTIRLDSDTNFSKYFGLVYPLEEGSAFEGRPKSLVYVYTKAGKNWKHTLEEREKIGFFKSMIDKFKKISKYGISVTKLTKFLRFTTDFNFGDLKVTDVMVEARVKVKMPDELSNIFNEGGDPAKDICFMIKSSLSRVFTEINLDNIDNLNKFTENVHQRAQQINIDYPYLTLESVTVQPKLPEKIEKAFEDIQKEKIEIKKLEAIKERERQEVIKESEKLQLKEEADLERKGLQLDKLGIHDIKIRLLMTDPEKRAQYLHEIYKSQMELLKENRLRASELIKMKMEIINKHFESISNPGTEHKEVKKLFDMLDQSIKLTSAESAFGINIQDNKTKRINDSSEKSD